MWCQIRGAIGRLKVKELTMYVPIDLVERQTESCNRESTKQFLIIMKPKKGYLAQLPTFVCTVWSTDGWAARYAAKRSNPRVFNNLDSRYCDLIARCIEDETTYIL